jgi:hypothetical protein
MVVQPRESQKKLTFDGFARGAHMEGKGRRQSRHHSFSIDDKVSSISPTQPNISHRLCGRESSSASSPFVRSYVRSSLLGSVLSYTVYDTEHRNSKVGRNLSRRGVRLRAYRIA